MSNSALDIQLNLDDPVDVADELMSRYGLTAIGVYDLTGRLLGFLTARDVLGAQERWIGGILGGERDRARLPTVSDIFGGETIDLRVGRDYRPVLSTRLRR